MAPNIQLATFVVSLIVIGLTANKFLSFHSYSKIFSGKPILQHFVEDEPSKHVENRQPLPKPSKRPEVLSRTSQVQSSTNKSLNVGRPLHKTRPGIYIEHTEQPKNVIFPYDAYPIVEDGSWIGEDVRRNHKGTYPKVFEEDYPLLDPDFDPHFGAVNVGRVNRTREPPVGRDILIYNRVMKCGSTTMLNHIYKLGVERNYDIKVNSKFSDYAMPLYNVERFCNYLKEYEFGGHYTGLLFEGHFGYIHCEGVVLNWMNVIRDPIDRMISMFYFLRLKTRWGLSEGRLKDMDRPPQEWFRKDLTTCIVSGDPECNFSPWVVHRRQQISYFCGQALECRRVGSRPAFQMAKENIERHYSVVGLTEDYASTLKVLRAVLPRFFLHKRDEKLAREGASTEIRQRNSSRRNKISTTAYNILRNNMSVEYELYDYVKQRLHSQIKNLGL